MKMKAIDLGIFVEMYNYDVWKGKLFLLFDETNDEITKKNLFEIDIAGMRSVDFYMRGDRTDSKILLYTPEYNGNYHIIEEIEWEERGDGERYFYFDLEHYLFVQRKVDYQLCIVPRHRLYSKTKSFEKL